MKVNARKSNVLLLMIFTLFIMLFFVLMVDINLSLLPYYSIISYVSLFVYLIYLYYLFRYQTRYVAVFSWMVLYLSSAIIAAVFIDTIPGFYLYEVGEVTKPSSSSLFLFILIFCSISAMIFSFKITCKKMKIKKPVYNPNWEGRLLLIILFSVSLFTIIFYINKPAFFLGMSKVVYSREVLSPFIDKVIRNSLVFVPAVGVIAYCCLSKVRLFARGALFLYILSLIWIGHKFGLVFYVFYFSLLLLVYISSNDKIKKTLILMSALFVVTIFLVLLSVSISFELNVSESLFYLINRISQQSEIWFSIQRLDGFNDWHFYEFMNEIKTIGKFNLSDDLHSIVGIYKAMSLSMPYQDYLARYENGQNLAFGFYPLINYYFDISLALIISVVLFSVYGVMLSILIYFLNNGYYFCSVLCTRLLLMMHAVLIQGDMFRLVSADSIICLTSLCLYFVFIRKFRRNTGVIANV